ncbi:MAG: hypothetical protein ACI8UO_002845 [Verrucomicrobiales bacterium]|jgi:hypothetical protein
MARKKIAVKKKMVRKKAAASAHGTPPGRPAAGPPPMAGRPAMPKKVKIPGEGVSIGGIIMLVVALILVGLIVMIFLPRNMDHIDGYPFVSAKAPDPPRNLLREVEDKLVAREGAVEFTEEELNAYLNQRLMSKQSGFFSSFVKMRGAYIDIKKNQIGVYIERTVFGMRFVVSAHFDVFQSNNSFRTEGKHCTLGKLKLPDGKMFSPIMAPYNRLAKECERELAILVDQDVEFVEIAEGKLTIRF